MARASITAKFVGDVTFDPGNVADGNVVEVTATVPGVRAGDIVFANKDVEDDTYVIATWVSDTDEITATFFNPSGSDVNGAEQSLRVIVF